MDRSTKDHWTLTLSFFCFKTFSFTCAAYFAIIFYI